MDRRRDLSGRAGHAPVGHKRDLQPPVLVERGDKVTLVYKVPGMTLTAQGQAIAQGGKGDVVDIINLQSRRTVSATVVSRGRVVVDAGFQRTASLEGAR